MADLTPERFAAALLHRLGIHQTPGAVQALVGWQRAEGGHWHNNARFNPLNTTQNMPGAGNTGSQGNIKVYRNWQQGLEATAKTLTNGRYGGILHALRAGDPGAVAGAIDHSPWGTHGALVYNAIKGTPRRAGVHAPSIGGTAPIARHGSAGSPGRAERIRTITETTPGVDNRFARAALIQSFLDDHSSLDPLDFAVQANALKDIAPTSTSRTIRTPGTPAVAGRTARSGGAHASFSTPKMQSGIANFEGKKVAAWIAPALQYARRHGWKGQVNSGYRSFADQQRIYNSGVRPAARPGTSNHEGANYPRGAVDVSDAPTLARILARSPYGGRLKWAGAKDPVHFSHPHGGSY